LPILIPWAAAQQLAGLPSLRPTHSGFHFLEFILEQFLLLSVCESPA